MCGLFISSRVHLLMGLYLSRVPFDVCKGNKNLQICSDEILTRYNVVNEKKSFSLFIWMMCLSFCSLQKPVSTPVSVFCAAEMFCPDLLSSNCSTASQTLAFFTLFDLQVT